MDVTKKAHELRELMRMREEIDAEIDSLKDDLKKEMTAQETDTLRGSDYKITWKTVTSARIDTRALKKDLPEIANLYTKESTTRRFLVA